MTPLQSITLRPLRRTTERPYVARLPGSKSYSNRGLLIAAQRPGNTLVSGALQAEDTDLLGRCLNAFGGLTVTPTDPGFRVTREPGKLLASDRELFIGGAGTPARLLLSFAADAQGSTLVTGIPRLCERPMGHLLDAMRRLGIRTECVAAPDCLPVRVHGGDPNESTVWEVDGSISSQFVTSLLLHAGRQVPGSPPVTVQVMGHLVSRCYVEMTAQIMTMAGIPVEQLTPKAWRVTPSIPKPARIEIEPDASAMSYLLGAAAITRTSVRIPGIGAASKQGDIGFARLLEAMGCKLLMRSDSIELEGRPLKGIEADMETMPDTVLTLAVVAAMAEGPTRITNIANLRFKECDRIAAATNELRKLGIAAIAGDDRLEIHPRGRVGRGRIETYNDHRVAMSFALLGLRNPGIEIAQPDCVAKSFPEFWQRYEEFKQHHERREPVDERVA